MKEKDQWIEDFRSSLANDSFVKLTLSKPREAAAMQNVYVREVLIKNLPMLSFTFHYERQDTVKNYNETEAIKMVDSLLGTDFQIGTLQSTSEEVTLRISRKGKMTLSRTKASITSKPGKTHDKIKIKRADASDAWLYHLGVTDERGSVIPRMADKYRQINKYLEVMDGLLKKAVLPENIHVVDMGSGKGYLTFALYDYLKNKRGLAVHVTGVEQREELVTLCNKLALQCGFSDLRFVPGLIQTFRESKVDILIALHACDTATDDALAIGMKAGAALIVCAPCCHKQIRQQLKGQQSENPVLSHGIYKEREYEMVTDTLRALIMEKNQYQTDIFEFISNEHTRKNIMLVGIKHGRPAAVDAIGKKIEWIKAWYGIGHHYLEKAMV